MNQPDLFGPSTPRKRYPRAHMRAVHREGRDQAEACLDKAERVDDFNGVAAAAFMVEWLRTNGQATGEILTDAAKLAGHRPTNDKCFGAVIGGLSRKGLIRCVGYGLRAKGHSTAGARIWEAAS